MQNLKEGVNYVGVRNSGPCKGTLVYVKYLRDYDIEEDEVDVGGLGVFSVLQNTFFGVDADFPGDDGWWKVGETVNVPYDGYDWTEDVEVAENE